MSPLWAALFSSWAWYVTSQGCRSSEYSHPTISVGNTHFVVTTRLIESFGSIGNGWLHELASGQCGEWTVEFQAVCNVLGDGFDVEIEGGCHLCSPCVIKNNWLKALQRCCKWWFLWSEEAAWKLQPSFDLGILLGLGRLGRSHPIAVGGLINKSKSTAGALLIKMLELNRSHQYWTQLHWTP